MTILYLHGLESKLNPAKREILEHFGTVVAPDMDYYNDSDVFKMLMELHRIHDFNVVIGSSMGGFMSYNYANTVNCPALLFNPALQQRLVVQKMPELNPANASSLLHFALGGKDTVVAANGNLQWLSENRMETTEFKISLHSKMEHQIPLDVFEIEVKEFFRHLKE